MKPKNQLKQSLKGDLKNPTETELNIISAILLQFAKIEYDANRKKTCQQDAAIPNLVQEISSHQIGLKPAA